MTPHAESIRTRAAALDDAMLLLAWRNDAVTRRMSLHSEAVSLEEHLAWYTASLSNPLRVIFIGEDAETGVAVGMVRFDSDASPSPIAEVSLNIAPEQRGRGLGRAVLEAAIVALDARHPEIRALTAVIRPENTASVRLFEAAGFHRIGESRETLTYRRDSV